MDKMISTLLNFDVFNRACQHNCTATFAKAAIALADSVGIEVTRDRELYRSTVTTSVKSVSYTHLTLPTKA